MVSIVVMERTHGVDPVFVRDERKGKRDPPVALWGRRRYISRSKFP
jgi:hypothetical protein